MCIIYGFNTQLENSLKIQGDFKLTSLKLQASQREITSWPAWNYKLFSLKLQAVQLEISSWPTWNYKLFSLKLRSTPYLHLIYTLSTPYLHLIYTLSTPYLIYTLSTPYLHLIYTLSLVTKNKNRVYLVGTPAHAWLTQCIFNTVLYIIS